MHFDQRTQQALREFGLSTDDIQALSETVVEATAADAEELESFFEDLDVVYSDMDQAHSAAEFPEHGLEYVDCYTHADDLRGYIKFEGWGASIEGGRVLSDAVVELSLGPTIHDRVRFAADRNEL